MNILRSDLAIHTTKFGNEFEMELRKHIFFTHTTGSSFLKNTAVAALQPAVAWGGVWGEGGHEAMP